LVFYLAAQFCIFGALRRTDASRVAPLLSLKVAVLAILSVASGQQLGLLQWAGVGLAVVSAWVLNGAGGHTPWRATVLVLAACVIYAFSDVCIYELLTRVREISGDRSTLGVPLWAFALVCVGVGLLALGALPWLGHRSPTAWRDAVPYALSWTMAMVALYACFAMLGTVLGAILQSTRGLISIGLGVLLAHLGWQHLEQKHGASVVGRRLVAAGLMTAAVALYVWGG
jgi:drug/metabolite transporter (DMT)-like permease